MSDLLDVENELNFENEITSYEYHEYSPFTPASLGQSDEINISIQNQDLLTDTAKSFIRVEGRILKDDGKTAGTAELVNNGICFLFDEIRFKMGATEISRCRNVGISSLMKNYVLLSPTEAKYMQQAGWDSPNAAIVKDGYFSALIPLRSLLGVSEINASPLLNVKQELILLRSRSDSDCLIAAAASTDKIQLSKVTWVVPHITVSDRMRLHLMKLVAEDRPLRVAFRQWEFYEHPLAENTKDSWTILTTTQTQRPQFVVVGLQSGRKSDVTKDNSKFDHCNIQDMRVYLNSQVFPYSSLDSQFSKNQYLQQYAAYARMKLAFDKSEVCEPLLSYIEFRDKAPLFVFDTSKVNDNLIDSTCDCRIEWQTDGTKIPKNTTAFALIIHHREIDYYPLSNTVKSIT